MNANETMDWIVYHGDLHDTWGKWWVAKEGRAAEAVYEALVEAFCRIELPDAKAASRAMLSGTIKRPYSAEQHVAAIVAYATNLAEQRRIAERSYVAPRDIVAERRNRDEYLREREEGKGILERFARSVGLIPPDQKRTTSRELLRQLHAATKAE